MIEKYLNGWAFDILDEETKNKIEEVIAQKWAEKFGLQGHTLPTIRRLVLENIKDYDYFTLHQLQEIGILDGWLNNQYSERGLHTYFTTRSDRKRYYIKRMTREEVNFWLDNLSLTRDQKAKLRQKAIKGMYPTLEFSMAIRKELSKRFGVSEGTISRDLIALNRKHRCKQIKKLYPTLKLSQEDRKALSIEFSVPIGTINKDIESLKK